MLMGIPLEMERDSENISFITEKGLKYDNGIHIVYKQFSFYPVVNARFPHYGDQTVNILRLRVI